ncbi:MAG: SRPBCC domain-containing protein [Pseudomonadota bacterium]
MVKAIEKKYVLPFPLEQVYQAWVSSDTVIPPATAMDIDPVAGGHYRLIMESPEFSARSEGVFSRVEPNQRLTYSWEWNGDGEVSEIDVVFTQHPDGTVISLTHSGFEKEQSRDMHATGWDSYAEGLTRHLEAQT